MNKKLLSIFGFGILILLVVISFTSAATLANFTAVPQHPFRYINDVVPLTLTNSDTINPITVNLPTQALIGVKITATLSYFSDPNATTPLPSNSVTVPKVGVGDPVTVYMKATPDTNNFMLTQGSTNGGTATITDNTLPTPNTATFFVNFQGNLDLTIDSTKVTSGFGSDQDWFPLDNIEAKVNIQNNGNDNIKSIVVKWQLYDTTKQKKVVSGEESSFSLNDGSDKNVIIDFQVPDTVIGKSSDDYVLYVWTTGNDEFFSGNPKTYSSTNNLKDLSDINIIVDSDFVILDNVQTTNTISCGNTVQITGTLWNIGDNDQDGVYIKIFNTDLGISQRVNVGTLDASDSKDLSFSVDIPTNAKSGQSYDLTFLVYGEDNNIFESSNNDKSQVVLTLPVTGACTNAPNALITANLQGNAPVAGQQFTVVATIINKDTKTDTFGLVLNDYENWASLVSVDRNTFSLNAGQSQDVTITLQANKGISGQQTFNIELAQGTQTLTQPVSVTVQAANSGVNLTGLFSGLGGNTYLWAIGALNIILVLVIIVVAVRVVRKK